MSETPNDDYEVDDLVENLNKKKKIKSGSKGKRGERDVVHELNARFASLLAANPTWGAFSRSVGSGNRWGQNVCLPKHAKDTFFGDITRPEKFRFVLESKLGYNDIDLFNCFSGRCKELDDFLKQVEDDSVRSGCMPMLIWKKDRKEKVAFMLQTDMAKCPLWEAPPVAQIFYKNWFGSPLTWLLTAPDKFFFDI